MKEHMSIFDCLKSSGLHQSLHRQSTETVLTENQHEDHS